MFLSPRRLGPRLTGIVLVVSLFSHAPGAAAAPFCPGNGPASLDPAFSTLVTRVGKATVGTATACTYMIDTGFFQQQTSFGSLTHNTDGTLSFESSFESPTPYKKWLLRPDGTFITPDGQQIGGPAAQGGTTLAPSNPAAPLAPVVAAPPAPVAPPPAPVADRTGPSPSAPQTAIDASAQATVADAIMPGRYGCFAQWGGSTSRQVNRTGFGITKEIYSDGTWRDTTFGSLTANDPTYAGPWSFDGAVLALTWQGSGQDSFTAQIGGDGQPQLVQFGEQTNMTCYLIEAL